jgi:hypothetical protein
VKKPGLRYDKTAYKFSSEYGICNAVSILSLNNKDSIDASLEIAK